LAMEVTELYFHRYSYCLVSNEHIQWTQYRFNDRDIIGTILYGQLSLTINCVNWTYKSF